MLQISFEFGLTRLTAEGVGGFMVGRLLASVDLMGSVVFVQGTAQGFVYRQALEWCQPFLKRSFFYCLLINPA